MNEHHDPQTPADARTHVVVAGGGYAGAIAANRLRSRDDVDVTLLNPRPAFVQRIRLHQLAAGTGAATADYATLLGDGVDLVVDTAVRIDAPARAVLLASGRRLHYDYLVYAVGSTGTTTAGVPGADRFAFRVAEYEQAERLRDRLRELPDGLGVTVVGGGLTGVETASELGARGRPVTLVCGGTLAPSLGPAARRSLARRLRRLGVEVLEARSVVEVRRAAVVLDDGTVRPSPLTVWTAGFGVPDLARTSGLSTDALGRLVTDATLTSVDDERVVAAGDAAAPAGRPLRMSCQAAGPLGAQAADTVLSRIAGKQPARIDQGFVGSCISLGRRDAVVQVTHRDDTPTPVFVAGRLGAAVKEAICRGTLVAIRREATRPGSTRWRGGGGGGGETRVADEPARPADTTGTVAAG